MYDYIERFFIAPIEAMLFLLLQIMSIKISSFSWLLVRIPVIIVIYASIILAIKYLVAYYTVENITIKSEKWFCSVHHHNSKSDTSNKFWKVACSANLCHSGLLSDWDRLVKSLWETGCNNCHDMRKNCGKMPKIIYLRNECRCNIVKIKYEPCQNDTTKVTTCSYYLCWLFFDSVLILVLVLLIW